MTAINKEVKQSIYSSVVSAESFSAFIKEGWDSRAIKGEAVVFGETTIKCGDSEKLTAWIAKKENATVQFGPFALSVKKSGVVFTYNGSTLLSRAWTTTKQLFGAVWDVLCYLSCKCAQGLVWLWEAFKGLFSKSDKATAAATPAATAATVADGEAASKKS